MLMIIAVELLWNEMKIRTAIKFKKFGHWLRVTAPIDSTFSLIGLFSTTEYVVESPVKILPRPVSARKKALVYFGTIQWLSPLVPLSTRTCSQLSPVFGSQRRETHQRREPVPNWSLFPPLCGYLQLRRLRTAVWVLYLPVADTWTNTCCSYGQKLLFL